jgi:hypothetical protein
MISTSLQRQHRSEQTDRSAGVPTVCGTGVLQMLVALSALAEAVGEAWASERVEAVMSISKLARAPRQCGVL